MEFLFDLFLRFSLRFYPHEIEDNKRQEGEGSGEDDDMGGVVVKENFGENGGQYQRDRSADPAYHHR